MWPRRWCCVVSGPPVESRVVHPGSEDYPQGLLDLEEPPSIHVAGTLGRAPAVAVIGTRKSTRYGLDLAEECGLGLSGAGWTVISGLARGIDAAAHRGTLAGSGHAVAVLGTGLDVWYPAENRHLYQGILDRGGGLLTEYPDGTPPDRWRFPQRNRLIAAISSAVVVVEAHERGGALITARLGAELGRPVFVVPGDVDRPASVGCNKLLRDGASPVLGAADLVEELSLVLGPPARPLSVPGELQLPPGGAAIEDLPLLWGCTFGEAMVRIGRMEASGEAVRSGSWLRPAKP